MKNKILGLLCFVFASIANYAQEINLPNPVIFDADTCAYIHSTGVGKNHFVVFYSNNKGTKVVLGKLNEKRDISFNTPRDVSYGVISKADVDCSEPGCDPVNKREGIQDIPLKVLSLTDEDFVLFYEDDKDPDVNVARLGTIQADTIALSNEQRFGNSGVVGVQGFDAIKLSDDKFVMAFNDDRIESEENDNRIGCILTKLTGNTNKPFNFSDFFPFTYDNNDALDLSMARTSENQFVVAYNNRCNNERGECVVATVKGNKIEYGPINVFSEEDISGIKVIPLENKQFVINYGVDSQMFNKDFGYSILGTTKKFANGTDIEFGPEYIFNSDGGTNYDMDALAIDKSTFLLFWSVGTMAETGKIVVGRVDKQNGKLAKENYQKRISGEIIFENITNQPLGKLSFVSLAFNTKGLIFNYQENKTIKKQGCSVCTDIKNIIPDIIVGEEDDINDNKNGVKVSVYPTLTRGDVYIDVKNNTKNMQVKVDVFSVLPAKKIMHKKLEFSENKINLGGEKEGYYILSIRVGNQLFTEKIKRYK
ncbi:MAG: hypothetical protein N4A74_06485 [Carboxylicivirga sp.]|jgi:hypothetical protein|nr:hypothetical protein [Carboxylicivirga sp.]